MALLLAGFPALGAAQTEDAHGAGGRSQDQGLRSEDLRPTSSGPEPLVELVPRLCETAVAIHGQAREADGSVSGWGGAGVIVHPDGYVLTNHHVAGRGQLMVVLRDASAFPGRFIGGDPGLDLALVKVDANRPLACATVLRDHDPRLGEEVVVIGNPNGLSHTVSTGIVSRVGGPDLQVSAAINTGNSGGPVFDRGGRLIGVVKTKGGEGIGFAIPIRAALERLPVTMLDPMERGARLGIAFDLVADRHRVLEGSPAAEAGLADGDVIRSVDGRPVENAMELFLRLVDAPPEQLRPLEREREGESASLEVQPQLVPLTPAASVDPVGFGIPYRIVRGTFDRLPDFDGLDVAEQGFAHEVSLGVLGLPEHRFGLQFVGYLEVPADGCWTFHLASDDGSALWIDGEKVIDLDGLHAVAERSAKRRLAAGLHTLRVDYFEQGGDKALTLEWSGPGVARAPLPRGSLRHDARN